MVRNEFDESNFYVSFMKKPKKKTIKYLEVAEEEEARFDTRLRHERRRRETDQSSDIDDFNRGEDSKFKLFSSGINSITIKTDQSETTINFYRAKSVLFYLIQRANDNNLKKYVKLISFVVGIVRGFVPVFIYLADGQFFPGSNTLYKTIYFAANFNRFLFYYYITKFILLSILDFRRKIYLMECLEGMITPDKTSFHKFVPTINMLDVSSAYTWLKMRRIVKDYGKSMTDRHELLITAVFIYMIFIYILNWGKNFKLIKSNSNFITELAPFLNIDYVAFSALILFLLLTIARVNRYYIHHILVVQRI